MKKTLPERIDEALAGKKATLSELACRLWPPETSPRAWRGSSHGGPHAWSRTLIAGVKRGGFTTVFNHVGPSGTWVFPRSGS